MKNNKKNKQTVSVFPRALTLWKQWYIYWMRMRTEKITDIYLSKTRWIGWHKWLIWMCHLRGLYLVSQRRYNIERFRWAKWAWQKSLPRLVWAMAANNSAYSAGKHSVQISYRFYLVLCFFFIKIGVSRLRQNLSLGMNCSIIFCICLFVCLCRFTYLNYAKNGAHMDE